MLPALLDMSDCDSSSCRRRSAIMRSLSTSRLIPWTLLGNGEVGAGTVGGEVLVGLEEDIVEVQVSVVLMDELILSFGATGCLLMSLVRRGYRDQRARAAKKASVFRPAVECVTRNGNATSWCMAS